MQAAHQGRRSRVSRGDTAQSVVALVGQGNRLNRPPRFYCRLQQCRMKTKHMRTVRGRAFRKQRNVLAGVKQSVNFGIHDLRMSAAATAQEHRVSSHSEPTDQWPSPDFGFRDECNRSGRIEHEDVYPGYMVGDDQAARFDGTQIGGEADAENVEHLA